MLTFTWVATHRLAHAGDCGLIGITPAGHLYVEEFYGEDWLAQHHLDENGQILQSVDEGIDGYFQPLPLPDDYTPPAAIKEALPLNHIGTRYRGMREAERLSAMVQPLSLLEKMPLLENLALNISPMMLAGIAESRVLAQASLEHDDLWLVCRRVLLAMMLPDVRTDADGQPYDYETLPLYSAHIYDAATNSQPALHEALAGIGGVTLTRPLDCLTQHGRLYIAEGGTASAGLPCQIHVWDVH